MANTKLPRDAEGREIPLDTECLYTYKGEKQDVLGFTYCRKEEKWEIETDLRTVNSIYLHITPPDSWKRLKEDLRRTMGASDAVCAYFGGDNRDCVACRLNKESFKGIPYCNPCLAFTDILDRIRKLRGEN
jgi:hypothetical protein